MNSDIKIVLTEQAAKQLEKFKDAQGKKLIDEIASRKHMPGDDEVEITAADIEKGRNNNRINITYPFLLSFYLIVGILLMIIGFNYDAIKEIFSKDDPLQVIILIGGCMFFLAGLSGLGLLILKGINTRIGPPFNRMRGTSFK